MAYNLIKDSVLVAERIKRNPGNWPKKLEQGFIQLSLGASCYYQITIRIYAFLTGDCTPNGS